MGYKFYIILVVVVTEEVCEWQVDEIFVKKEHEHKLLIFDGKTSKLCRFIAVEAYVNHE